ncbi:twinkle mtDNA helicase-like [Liolophura sinensis]|uniref:twinkle mtDNA helicase-like n=1 Tax=Liolophura sinensis TaxID=3198878 RepID=UPI003158E626
MKAAQLLRQQNATNINLKQNLRDRTISENFSKIVQGRTSLGQNYHCVLNDKEERQVIAKGYQYGARCLVDKISNVQKNRSFFTKRYSSILHMRGNRCIEALSPEECTDVSMDGCRKHPRDPGSPYHVKSYQRLQKMNLLNSICEEGSILSPRHFKQFLQNSSDFWGNSFISSSRRSYSGIAWFSKQNTCGKCGRVKGGNSSVNKRNLSSPPLTNVTNSGQAASKSPADEIGRPWTTLQARDYGKSIPVLQEPVTVMPADIKKYLTAQSLKFENGHTCFITSCPRLNKRKTKLDETEKIYINMTTGSFVCHACRKVGAWSQFQDNVSLLKGTRRKKDQDCFPEMESNYNAPRSAVMTALWESSLPWHDVSEDDLDHLLHVSSLQGLSPSVLKAYGVRVDQSREAFLVPVYFVDNTIHAVKKIAVKTADDGTLKGTRETIIPRGDVHGLIGWNTIAPSTNEVVLTASEFDAMAVYQETKVPAIALPKGDSVLPQEILPLLEQFKKIVLWFKNDIRSWEAAKQFTKKLNEKRCFVIRPSSEHPNALEALQRGSNLHRILEHARPVTHQSITAFSQLRQEVYSELAHVEQVAGVKWKRYPHLNKLLKGHRRGELTIFTGPTGSGKTTFISDYSLDLCVQGVNTLWGSFEINNVRLMKMMLTQFAQQNMSKNLREFDHWADQFENLPMYFMTFFGQESIKKVIETMSHAVYVHDIAHVVVDNLQFMMGVESDRLMMDRFQRTRSDRRCIRKFATTMNCHVTVVVHPRKEKDNDELTTASIYGSAKATQEADNVMILQDKRLMSLRGKKYLQIAKNRFDGELGVMLLKFDKDTLSFAIKPQKAEKSKSQEDYDLQAEEDNIASHEDRV